MEDEIYQRYLTDNYTSIPMYFDNDDLITLQMGEDVEIGDLIYIDDFGIGRKVNNKENNMGEYTFKFTGTSGQMNDDAFYDLFGCTNPRVKTHAEKSQIKEVRVKHPATIIFWKDGTRTVAVQREGDEIWDAEKGFTFAYLKHPNFDYKQFCWDMKHFCL